MFSLELLPFTQSTLERRLWGASCVRPVRSSVHTALSRFGRVSERGSLRLCSTAHELPSHLAFSSISSKSKYLLSHNWQRKSYDTAPHQRCLRRVFQELPKGSPANSSVCNRPSACWSGPNILLVNKSDRLSEKLGRHPRWFTTTHTSSSRLWLARFPESPTIWTRLFKGGAHGTGGSLQEVVLPCRPGTVSLALGTADVLALSDGSLFGAPLSLARVQEDRPEPLALRDITPEPVEAGGISVNDFNRHCSMGEELGINLALTNAAADGFPMHFETDTHVRFVKVAAGKHHFAALSSHGILYTWGKGGTWGAGSPLGQGDRKNRSRPTPVGQFVRAGEFVVDVACGATSTCVATSSGRVFSSGAADYGVNGSGMLISSRVFRELEFFRGLLSPKLLEAQRLVEEGQLKELEALRERFDQEGVNLSHLPMRPFDAFQEAPEDSTCKNTTRCRGYSVTGHLGLPKVMASGGESNYPLLVDFFTRSDVPLGSCALGPNHTVALAKSGMVYEWGGRSAESPHPVDLHWSYPESIFKDCVMKVAAGGFSSSTAFSVALTGKGEAFFWGPGASMLPLGVSPAYDHIPQLINAALPTQESEREDDTGSVRIRDIVAGPCGCLLMTTDSLSPCFVR